MQEAGKRTHEAITYIGFRAHATSVGLLQLTKEFRRAGVLDDNAISRIKIVVCNDLSLSYRPSILKSDFEAMIHRGLDQLFSCEASPGGNQERSSSASTR